MATAFIRTIVLYFLIMIGLRLLGKRQIGELEPIELVLTLLISDLAAVPMQDFGIPLLNGVIPIVTLLSLFPWSQPLCSAVARMFVGCVRAHGRGEASAEDSILFPPRRPAISSRALALVMEMRSMVSFLICVFCFSYISNRMLSG